MALPADPRGRELFLLVHRDAYERWLAAEVQTVLEAAFREISQTMVTRYASLSANEKRRISQLFAQVGRQLQLAYGTAEALVDRELTAYTTLESRIARAQLEGIVARADVDLSFDILPKAKVTTVTEFPVAGLNIGEWWETQARNMTLATRRAIQMGLLQNETSAQIVQRIMPLDAATSTAFKQARNSARTLVRTSMTSVQAQSHLLTYKAAGKRVTHSYRIIVVRDNRTSPICRALSNKVFRYDDEKRKTPPFHPNCRTTIIPLVNYRELGLPEPDPHGPLSFQSYSNWLKEQNASVQGEILGPARAAMFEKGTSLEQLVATDGRQLTLSQLRKRLALS